MPRHKGEAVLFSEMTPGDDFEDEFNRWYDEEHIPVRMKCAGFVSGQRYRTNGAPGYLAVYELDHLDVLKTESYAAIKNNPSPLTAQMLSQVTGFTRYLAAETSVAARDDDPERQIDAPVLYAVFFNVPQDSFEAFDAWYEQDHVPLLMQSPDWLMVRRLRIADGAPETFTHLALHYLADIRALASPEREKARNTPWRAEIARNPWFKGKYIVFDRHGRRQLATS